jgi:hypothetical protein
VEFRILGPVEVRTDGRAVPLGGAKPRAARALLPRVDNAMDAVAVGVACIVASGRPFETIPPGPSWPRRDLDAPGRIRTCDLSLRRRALYPLSYGRLAEAA